MRYALMGHCIKCLFFRAVHCTTIVLNVLCWLLWTGNVSKCSLEVLHVIWQALRRHTVVYIYNLFRLEYFTILESFSSESIDMRGQCSFRFAKIPKTNSGDIQTNYIPIEFGEERVHSKNIHIISYDSGSFPK